jgi:hypothetical protein
MLTEDTMQVTVEGTLEPYTFTWSIDDRYKTTS